MAELFILLPVYRMITGESGSTGIESRYRMNNLLKFVGEVFPLVPVAKGGCNAESGDNSSQPQNK